jgi:alpha-mannosidase
MLSNISQCEVSENNDKFVVTLYNPLGQLATQYVRLPIIDDATQTFKIYDPTGISTNSIILKYIKIQKYFKTNNFIPDNSTVIHKTTTTYI